MSLPHEAWKVNTYPFLGRDTTKCGEVGELGWGKPMNRLQVISWYEKHSLPVPPKSSCVFCPYHSDRSWAMKKLKTPDDFLHAVAVDDAIRNSGSKGIRSPLYLHRSCRPLRDVAFDLEQAEEWGECSGNCHI